MRALVFILMALLVPAITELIPARQVSAQQGVTFVLDQVVGGLSSPVFLNHAGDGSGRLFVVEQAGRILIVRNGGVLPTPFLDIRGQVSFGGERGLLSVAFHPDFKNNRRFFVNYTARRPNLMTIIAEYQASMSNPDLAHTAEQVLLTIDQPFDNHNGGQLQFGPDGYLYIGMGDGGSGGDPLGHGQNLNSLLGKVLRIDVNGAFPYRIPPDNPLVNGPGADEIWALGLRNPWRFSFDRLNGRLFLADVGQNTMEEVDVVDRGSNLGWNVMEGSRCFQPPNGCSTAGLTLPISEYTHSLGSSITGGYVYRGNAHPQLRGTYLFGDFGSGRIWGLTETNLGTWTRTELRGPGFNISSFGEDEEGEIYVVNYSGSIHRIRITGSPGDVNPEVLIPSTARTGRFTSLLTVLNPGSTSDTIELFSRSSGGSVLGSSSQVVPGKGFFRAVDILGELGVPEGSFGPLTVRSLTGRPLVVVSEVRSQQATAGFLPGLTVSSGGLDLLLPEVVDSGTRGQAGTFRTNLGVNNLGDIDAEVQIEMIDSSGATLGMQSIRVPGRGMSQIDGIARTLANKETEGYLKLSSQRPIHAWASKINNATDDPSLEVALGSGFDESGVKLLIPSVSGTDRFKSLVVVVNRGGKSNDLVLTARDTGGNVVARLNRSVPVRGIFRSTDVLREMGAPVGAFGPLTIESSNGELFSAVSEVYSAEGTAGFFPAVAPSSATLRRLIPEILSNGSSGEGGTFRTNIGVNNLGFVSANVVVEFVGRDGQIVSETSFSVPSKGLAQISVGPTPPVGSYAMIRADQPVHAWATKIDNGSQDPSVVMSVASE
ncbi:MAG: PQQ-dependent sugar dehydrogenase [Acidobacteriota bacterium]